MTRVPWCFLFCYLGCCYATQLHPAAAAADYSPRTVPRSLPTWCRLQSHRSTHQRGHCCERRWVDSNWVSSIAGHNSSCKERHLYDHQLSPESAPHQHELIDHRTCFLYAVCFLFTALATLKPQAGLVAPQAVPASQPTAAVRNLPWIPVNKILIRNALHNLFPYFLLTNSISASCISGCWWRAYGD